jgi:hypothetical protein
MAADIDQSGGKLKELLPRPVRMSKGSSLLIKITGKTKPGRYAIALLCADKHNQPDSVDVKTVRIYQERYSEHCFRGSPLHGSTSEEISRHAVIGN